jgi:hypothetical protein
VCVCVCKRIYPELIFIDNEKVLKNNTALTRA